MKDQHPITPASWRVVIFTVIPGGVVYTMANTVLRALGHRIVGVVTTPGPQRRRSATYLEVVAAVPPGVDIIVSNHPDRWAAMLAPLKPDLIICGGFPWRIPAEVVALPRFGAINYHDSLLPRHRGPNASGWMFRSGDTETALTLHRVTPEFDAGPILAQARMPIGDDDTWSSIAAHIAVQMPRLLEQALARIARGEAGDPQDEQLATDAGLFEDAWRIIDWSQPARTVHNQVRSWVGTRDLPAGALGMVDGQTWQITRTRLLPGAPTRGEIPPGTVLQRDAEHVVVQCGDGPLAILAWALAEDHREQPNALVS